MEKLLFYEKKNHETLVFQNYGTIPKDMALQFTREKHGILSKTKKI